MAAPNTPREKAPGAPQDKGEICYACTGITTKLSGASTTCYGVRTKVRRKTENIPYQFSEDPLTPKTFHIIIGKTVTTEKLEKENRPPLTIFGTSIIYLHDAPAPNTEDLKAPSAQPQPPSESKIPPGMTKERQKEAAGLNEQAIKKRIAEQKPAMTPAETVEFLKKRMETGVAIQWQGMRSTYALLTENFPARMTRGSELMLQSMRRTADALTKAVQSKVFDRNNKD